jgi:hypothetical protein
VPVISEDVFVPGIQVERPIHFSDLTRPLDQGTLDQRVEQPETWRQTIGQIETRYQRVLTHELAHLYHLLGFNFCLPKWFDEGVAEYVSHEMPHRHSSDKAFEKERKAIFKGAQALLADPNFKGLESLHSYIDWVNFQDPDEQHQGRHYSLAYQFVYGMMTHEDGSTFDQKKQQLLELMRSFSSETRVLPFVEGAMRQNTKPETAFISYQEHHLKNLTPERFAKTMQTYGFNDFYKTHQHWLRKP